jgi:hypothetical protein
MTSRGEEAVEPKRIFSYVFMEKSALHFIFVDNANKKSK